MNRRHIVLLCVAASLSVVSTAHAQQFPIAGKPIRIVVPFPAGGQADVQARAIGQKLAESLGVSVGSSNGSKIIKGAMFLMTDNAQAQATLLLGPEKILRLEPEGDAAAIELDDWTSAKAMLPPLAKADLAANHDRIAEFFPDKVASGGRGDSGGVKAGHRP